MLFIPYKIKPWPPYVVVATLNVRERAPTSTLGIDRLVLSLS
jgi:hypothetical protein